MKGLFKSLLLVASVAAASVASGVSANSEGVINVASQHTVSQTAERMLQILEKKGMTVFNHIKHSDGAAKVDIELRDTELVIFGNPKVGSPLMQCQQLMALDLPQKALVWQDEAGKVWISYNDPQYLAKRHSMQGCEAVLSKVSGALAGISKAAAN
ncbi:MULTISPECIES: DUF302 domain-containing protein [unclassified Agarivorans]|uniref:DUF302 domain-containing protein n=1 Tax=unclassified Agarivorans TaxID=2636026 RepID=UPI0026E24F8B|nr:MULTISPECIES: DUF302 domain-containing protein [unclassified Agarivorans]MDO6684347.1 DUF302 domain-containing protein [Agarivorans sp. 3_MG-2023]MDO6714512.1 DUF302 domain-containing protein [Agarivorans sp. 2_MG-2023]